MRLPVVLVGDYSLPAFVSPSTLVFAVSFSGDTEETLEAAEAAVRRGARLVAVASRGSLAELAASVGAPVFETLAGIPQPRAGVATMAAPLLVTMERLGLLTGITPAIGAAVDQLKRRRDSLVGGGGVAPEIARRLGRTIPLVQGASGIGAVAARRWKTQLNENAKEPAFFATQPEWCHNEICGFGQNGDVTRAGGDDRDAAQRLRAPAGASGVSASSRNSSGRPWRRCWRCEPRGRGASHSSST